MAEILIQVLLFIYGVSRPAKCINYKYLYNRKKNDFFQNVVSVLVEL